jgi:hypothetical protein
MLFQQTKLLTLRGDKNHFKKNFKTGGWPSFSPQDEILTQIVLLFLSPLQSGQQICKPVFCNSRKVN